MSKNIKDKKEHEPLSIFFKGLDIIFFTSWILIVFLLIWKSITYFLGNPNLLSNPFMQFEVSNKQALPPIVILIISVNANLMARRR